MRSDLQFPFFPIADRGGGWGYNWIWILYDPAKIINVLFLLCINLISRIYTLCFFMFSFHISFPRVFLREDRELDDEEEAAAAEWSGMDGVWWSSHHIIFGAERRNENDIQEFRSHCRGGEMRGGAVGSIDIRICSHVSHPRHKSQRKETEWNLILWRRKKSIKQF